MQTIIFSDVDGTLLNSQGKISPDTLCAIRTLKEKGIPFVISSGRGPTGIYPILEEYGLRCPMIAHSGGAILDENGNVLFLRGMEKETVRRLVDFVEREQLDMAWSLHSLNQWIVKDRTDPRVVKQEKIVRDRAQNGTVDSIEAPQVYKMLAISTPDKLEQVRQRLVEAFPELNIVISAEDLLDIMDASVTKGKAVEELCRIWNVPTADTIAFGDNFNDVEMLSTVGKGFLMGNAPEGMKARFPLHTLDNDHDGIPHALKQLGIL